MLQQHLFIQRGQHTVNMKSAEADAQPNNLYLEAIIVPHLGQWMLQQHMFMHKGQHTVSIKSAAAVPPPNQGC
jgi:hypothetical protein